MDSLIETNDLKFVFVGGKGGVGKTTSSSGIATSLAQSGKRVLLVSTDPAHSLSDAFRTPFNNAPTKANPNLPLWVMEVDPTESMKEELGTWTKLAAEFDTGDSKKKEVEGEEDGEEDLSEKIRGFQEWLSGIPGIDEATALSSAIGHIESGEYDIIVFDTAPTGHTVKLLQLPDILQVGLDKLESWSTTIYSYWESFKGVMKNAKNTATGAEAADEQKLTAKTKQEITEKLRKYKAGIARVGKMLTDTERTRFVVVCIAEYLSISESQRLLQELEKCKVTASHIIVNQLVKEDAHLNKEEMAKIDKWASDPRMSEGMKKVAAKARNACLLTSSRHAIQSKYLKELKTYEEVKKAKLTIVEVPLLPSEVTGYAAIENFAVLLTNKKPLKQEETQPAKKQKLYESDDGGAAAGGAAGDNAAMPPNPMVDKVKALLEDPEIKALVDASPKAQAAVEDLVGNPMNVMKYMMDPELAPLVQACMGKLGFGGQK